MICVCASNSNKTCSTSHQRTHPTVRDPSTGNCTTWNRPKEGKCACAMTAAYTWSRLDGNEAGFPRRVAQDQAQNRNVAVSLTRTCCSAVDSDVSSLSRDVHCATPSVVNGSIIGDIFDQPLMPQWIDDDGDVSSDVSGDVYVYGQIESVVRSRWHSQDIRVGAAPPSGQNEQFTSVTKGTW